MKDSTYEKYCLVVDEWFINGFNGSAAYKKYYPSSKRPDDSFSKIQRIPEVQKYIESKQELAKKELSIDHSDLLKTLNDWLYSDITETFMLSTDDLKKLPLSVRQLITEYTIDSKKIGDVATESKVKLKFVSKEKAAEMIARHIGFYEKDNKQQNPSNGRVKLVFDDGTEREDNTD